MVSTNPNCPLWWHALTSDRQNGRLPGISMLLCLSISSSLDACVLAERDRKNFGSSSPEQPNQAQTWFSLYQHRMPASTSSSAGRHPTSAFFATKPRRGPGLAPTRSSSATRSGITSRRGKKQGAEKRRVSDAVRFLLHDFLCIHPLSLLFPFGPTVHFPLPLLLSIVLPSPSPSVPLELPPRPLPPLSTLISLALSSPLFPLRVLSSAGPT